MIVKRKYTLKDGTVQEKIYYYGTDAILHPKQPKPEKVKVKKERISHAVKFAKEQVLDLIVDHIKGMQVADLSKKYNISREWVYAILRGEVRNDVHKGKSYWNIARPARVVRCAV